VLSISFEPPVTPLNWRKRNRGWVYRGGETYTAFREVARGKDMERRRSGS
jgi:hypothetical protein